MYICTASILYCSGQSPGRCSRYWTHLFPNSRWSLRMMASSLADHGPCLICGLRWFRYLSRHCLPVRGAILAPMVDLIYITCAVRSILRHGHEQLTSIHKNHVVLLIRRAFCLLPSSKASYECYHYHT